MKTLVFSDTHLTPVFDEQKYGVLVDVITQHDKVIINGDFWEGFLCSFDEFMRSEWNKLFPLLRTKKTVYLFGNHDTAELNDLNRMNIFSQIATETFELIDGDKHFHFEHGHRYIPINGLNSPIGSLLFRTEIHFWNGVERSVIALGGSRYQQHTKKYNTVMKQKSMDIRDNNQILICGHTHSQELDLNNNFANSGVCKFGLMQYLTIENGNVSAVSIEY